MADMADTVPVSGAEQPTSLADAHELVRRQRPAPDAELLVWVAYHRRNAEIYALVALIDIGERREAQAHAGQEMRFARAIEDELEEANKTSDVDKQASSE